MQLDTYTSNRKKKKFSNFCEKKKLKKNNKQNAGARMFCKL